MFDYQLLAPIYFLGVPKPIHFLPIQSKSTNFLQISEDKNDSAEKMEVDGENTADLEDEKILPRMRKLEDLKPPETKAMKRVMKVCVDVEDLEVTPRRFRRSWRRRRSPRRDCP